MSAKAHKKKGLSSSSSSKKTASTAPTGKKNAPPPPPPRARILKIAEDPRLKLAREQYEAAVGLLSNHKYERAIGMFEKVLEGPSVELSERSRVHISICRSRVETRIPAFKTAEDHYNYAVAQSNSGKLAEAEEHLQKALKLAPKAAHLYYAMAAVRVLRGDIEASLSNLKQAIEIDNRNRYLARSDSDFRALYEDPRFADLVYPDRMD